MAQVKPAEFAVTCARYFEKRYPTHRMQIRQAWEYVTELRDAERESEETTTIPRIRL